MSFLLTMYYIQDEVLDLHLTAIQSFGRPKNIELLTLIDRRFSRHLPIQPNYRGRQVDAIDNEKSKSKLGRE